MQKEFDKIIEGLLSERETALLAVSGGVDSMCLAELFGRSSSGRNFAVAHCNFHLRGEESDGDEALVRTWAEAHGVRFHKADFDTEEYAEAHSESIEMAARDLRYAWFAELCREHGYAAVAVAHNANDNAETLMLNMLRGTGLRGLTGMKADSSVPVPGAADVRLIRPMLGFTRAKIEEFSGIYGIGYRVDHTNNETVYKRNKLRNNVFPVFSEINPSFLRTFSREMNMFSQENEIADDYFREASLRVNEEPLSGECLRVDMNSLLAEKHWKYVLYRLLEPYGFRDRLLEPVVKLIGTGRTFSGRVFESPGYRLMTLPGKMVVNACAPGINSLEIQENRGLCIVRTAGEYAFDGCRFSVELTDNAALDNPVMFARAAVSEETLVADGNALSMPFVVRGWRQGDWMRPLGMKGCKKLSDLFTDLKVGVGDKSKALVAVVPAWNAAGANEKSGDYIAAVCGYASGSFYCRVDESVKVSSSTTCIMKLHLSPANLFGSTK